MKLKFCSNIIKDTLLSTKGWLLLLCVSFAPLAHGNVPDSPETLAKQIIYNQNPWLLENSNSLELKSSKESLIGNHMLFVQLHQGFPVYEGDVKINISKSGKILSVFNNLKPLFGLLPKLALNGAKQYAYYLNEKNWQQVEVRIEPNALGERVENVYTLEGAIIKRRLLDLKAGKDTLIQSSVYKPDPITTSQKPYGDGGLYKNNNGADAPELTAEQKSVSITLQISNDTFYARSPYAIVLDLESPAQAVFQSKNPVFNFTRSNPFFREMNVMYHIEQSRMYYASIGFPFSQMKPIWVDPTAYQGQDQSRFSFVGSQPALFFGTGGVPDAEDADVVVHEYTHAINNFIAPGTDNGNERLAMEEANCDFIACQYSRALSDYKWREVFNWDGHNEYWGGRNANSPNVYPKDLSSDFYQSSLIWSSMLNDLSEDFNREIVSKLLFTSIYSYANFMTMQQGADLLMQADSLLYGFRHFDGLAYRLNQRGFSVYTSIKENLPNASLFELLNSEGFASGEGALQIHLLKGGNGQLRVWDMKGRQIYATQMEKGEVELFPQQFSPGMYFLELTGDNGQRQIVKLLRK